MCVAMQGIEARCLSSNRAFFKRDMFMRVRVDLCATARRKAAVYGRPREICGIIEGVENLRDE